MKDKPYTEELDDDLDLYEDYDDEIEREQNEYVARKREAKARRSSR